MGKRKYRPSALLQSTKIVQKKSEITDDGLLMHRYTIKPLRAFLFILYTALTAGLVVLIYILITAPWLLDRILGF